MTEKIKKYLKVIFYILIWAIFLFLLTGVIGGLERIITGGLMAKWWIFLLIIFGWLLSIYLLRHHFKFLRNKLSKDLISYAVFYGALYSCIYIILDKFIYTRRFDEAPYLPAIPFWLVLIFIIEFIKKHKTK